MNREMELVRKVLLETEEHAKPVGWLNLNIDGYDKETVSYHVKLLAEAGFLTAENLTTHDGGFCWMPKSLTWKGHEFVDTIKNDTVWKKTKDFVQEKGGAISIEMLKVIAVRIASAHFGVG